MIAQSPVELSSREELYKRLPAGGIYAEIGVQAGYNAALMNYIARPELLVLIDAWRHIDGPYAADPSDADEAKQDELYRFVRDRFGAFGNTRVRRALAHGAAAEYLDGFFDFVYLDACHLFEAVAQDMQDWWPKVKPGGLLAGHDYYNVDVPWIEVKRAVDEFCAAQGLSLAYITTEPCGSWAIRKPEVAV